MIRVPKKQWKQMVVKAFEESPKKVLADLRAVKKMRNLKLKISGDSFDMKVHTDLTVKFEEKLLRYFQKKRELPSKYKDEAALLLRASLSDAQDHYFFYLHQCSRDPVNEKQYRVEFGKDVGTTFESYLELRNFSNVRAIFTPKKIAEISHAYLQLMNDAQKHLRAFKRSN